MKISLIFLSLFFVSLCLHGNNGEIAFSNRMSNFSLDGKMDEWKHLKPVPIDLYLGNYSNPLDDCSASFKSGYDEDKVFFAVQIRDNNTVSNPNSAWHENDGVVIYLNFCHSNDQSGVARIIMNQDRIEIQNHDQHKDRCHSFLNESNVKHRYIQLKDTSFYEVVVSADETIESFQTIGLDFYILDIDKGEETETEIYWGPSNFHKYYMPGYLGDLVFHDGYSTELSSLSGQVAWDEKEPSPTPFPKTVDIKSEGFPKFKVSAVVDSLGKFKVDLPAGKYYVRSADKNTSLFDQQGYTNQRKINTFDKIEFELFNKAHLKVDVLKLRTYSVPEYLFQPTGILHDYTKGDENKIDHFIESYKSYFDIPAVSFALIKDNKVEYSKNYGAANLISDLPIQQNSVFQIASVTKSVFSFIVMRLVEKGVIDLDKPLHEYYPFKQIEHNEGYEQITARLALSHQSGLPNWAWGGTGGWKYGKKADLSFFPGTRYQYSGEGYEYLSRVVEHLTSKSLSELLDEEFKRPLGINKLFFRINDSIQQVRGNFGSNTTLWNSTLSAGAAHSILTDAETFAKFVCELGKQRALTKESYQEMFTPLQPVFGFEHPENLYWNQGIGLGFFTQESKFGKAVMHGGNNSDFQGEFVYYLDQKIGFVMFTNSNRGHKLGQELGRFLLHGKK